MRQPQLLYPPEAASRSSVLSGSGAVSLEASTGGLSSRGNTNLDMYGDTTVHGNLYVTDEMTYSETYSTFVHVTTNQM